MPLNTSGITRGEASSDGGLRPAAGAWNMTAHHCYILLQQNRTGLDVADCHAATARAEDGALSTAAIVFGTTILLANLPVILGIGKKRSLHKPMYYFIANMAGVDAVVGVMCFVLPAVRRAGGGEGTYLKLYTTFFFSIFLSLTGLVLLTLDRYISIYHSLFHQTRITGTHVAAAVVFTWVLSGLVCYSPLLGWTCDTTNTPPDTCLYSVDLNYFIFLLTIILAAVSIVVIMNIRMYATLRRRLLAVGVEGVGYLHMNAQQLTTAKRKATTVAILAFACVVSWTPCVVAMVQLLDSFYMRSAKERLAYSKGVWGVAVVFLGVFPILNPILYAFRLPQLRKAVKSLFQDCWACCRRCCRVRNANQVVPIAIVNIEVDTTDSPPTVNVR